MPAYTELTALPQWNLSIVASGWAVQLSKQYLDADQ